VAQLNNRRTAEVVQGGHIADSSGFSNCPDPLPDKGVFLRDLEQRGISESLSEIVRFFTGEHQHYFEEAQAALEEGKPAEALENYILYLYTDGGRTPRCFRQAEDVVAQQMRRPLVDVQ